MVLSVQALQYCKADILHHSLVQREGPNNSLLCLLGPSDKIPLTSVGCKRGFIMPVKQWDCTSATGDILERK